MSMTIVNNSHDVQRGILQHQIRVFQRLFSCEKRGSIEMHQTAVFNWQKQEKPTNCGIKAADVLAIFFTGKLKCESTEYFGGFATTMT